MLLAVDPGVDHFVEVFSGSILELAARTQYQDETVRTELVELVHGLQKVTVEDPKPDSGQPLHYYNDPESTLWKICLIMEWRALGGELILISHLPQGPIDVPGVRKFGRW
jgi:hypothetical protein